MNIAWFEKHFNAQSKAHKKDGNNNTVLCGAITGHERMQNGEAENVSKRKLSMK